MKNASVPSQSHRKMRLNKLLLPLKDFLTGTVPRWWNLVPPKVQWSCVIAILGFVLVLYLGRGHAIVIQPFQLPPESKEHSLPFNGVTIANTLRDAMTALGEEAAGRQVPSPCDFLATEDINFEALIAQSNTSYQSPDGASRTALAEFGVESSVSFQIHGPFDVEVSGLSREGVNSLARDLMGHVKVISGDLVLDGPDSFQLMARTNNGGPWTVDSQPTSLSGLKKASCAMAEQILKRTDRNLIAAALIRRRKYVDVVRLYGTLAAEDQQNADALNNLGVALFMTGHIDDAVSKFHQALALKKNFPEPHDNLGNVFGCQRRHKDAIIEYRKAIELNPRLPEAQRNLGMALSLTGNWDQAVDAYKEAVRLKPDDPVKHVLLGTALVFTHKPDEAATELNKAIEMDPDNAEVHRGVGAALQAGGESEQAIAEYKKAIELKPDLLGPHLELSGVFLLTKHLDEAVSECRKVVELKPDSPQGHVCLGGALAIKAEDLFASPLTPQVFAEYRKAIELNPDFSGAHNGLGVALLLTGQFNEAISELKKVVALDPNSPEAHNELGKALNMRGGYDEGAAEFEKALALKPDFPDAQKNLKEAFAAKTRKSQFR
jgi:tetratricopeptide (TPR) repeat protein